MDPGHIPRGQAKSYELGAGVDLVNGFSYSVVDLIVQIGIDGVLRF